MAAPAVQRARAVPLRFSTLLSRLALAGLVSGLLAGVWLLLVTERGIGPALELDAAHPRPDTHEEVFSRTTQLIGGVVGMVLAGVVLGVVVSVLYALVRHRLPGRSELARLGLLAAIGFAVVGLLPAIKIPANPPAVAVEGTVGRRTAIYLGVLLCGAVIVMLVAALVSLLQERGVAAGTTVVAGTALAVALGVLVVVVLPDSPDSVPADVPAELLWNFRLASLGQQAVLWGTLALAGGWLLDRATVGRPGHPDG